MSLATTPPEAECGAGDQIRAWTSRALLGRHCQGPGRWPPRRWGPRLGRAVSHLNSVMDTPELRAAYNEALPGHRVLDPSGQRRAPVRQVQGHRPEQRLNAEQAQALKNAMRNFVLGRRRAAGAAKARYAEIQEPWPS